MKRQMIKLLVGLTAAAAVFFISPSGAGLSEAANPAAKIGEVTYETLAEAVADVKMGETITLLEDNSENINPTTAFYIEGAEYTGTVSEDANYRLQTLDEDEKQYIVNGKAIAYRSDTANATEGTLDQVFSELYGPGKSQSARAWMPVPGKEDMGWGVGLWGDTIMTDDYDNMNNRGNSTTMAIVIMEDLTFDMNGHTYKQGTDFKGWGGYPVFANGLRHDDNGEYFPTHLVIRDSAGGGCMTGAVYGIYSWTGSVTMESGTIATDASAHVAPGGFCTHANSWNYTEKDNFEATVRLWYGCNFTMTGGTISNTGKWVQYGGSGCICYYGYGNTVNISGGTLEIPTDGGEWNSGIFYVKDGGCPDSALNISGGDLKGYIGNIYYGDEEKDGDSRINTAISGGIFSDEIMADADTDYVRDPAYTDYTYWNYLFDSVVANRCLIKDAGKGTLSVADHAPEITQATITCEEPGRNKIIYCPNCGRYFTSEACTEVISKEEAEKTVPAAGHTWEDFFTVDEEPTCTKAGSRSVHCSVCKTAKKYELEIPATGHSFGEWETVESPDCTNTGSSRRECSVCRYTETKALDAAGHDWEAEYTVDRAATCTEDGSKSVHCKNCDAVMYSTVIPATGHSFGEWETVTEPTCTEKGSSRRVCAACGAEELKEIEASGHSWENEYTVEQAATCTEDGKQSVHCKVCDAKKYTLAIPALGHRYVGGKCEVCGEADPDFKPDDGKMTEAEAVKADLEKEISTVKILIDAGQQNYTGESWKFLLEAYAAAQGAPENADAAALKALFAKLTVARLSLKVDADAPQDADGVAEGDEFRICCRRYKVISAEKKTVRLVWAKNKKASSATIPADVTFKGEKYKVVEIGPKVFKDFKRLKKIILGKNLKAIGKQAFSGCKKLKTVVVKGTALTKVRADAFKNTSPQMTVKVPKKMTAKRRASLLKKMKKAGMSKTAKMK